MVHIWGLVESGYETDIGWDTQRADAKFPCEYHAWIMLVWCDWLSFSSWPHSFTSFRTSSSNCMIVDMLSSVKRQIMKMELDALSMLSSSCLLISSWTTLCTKIWSSEVAMYGIYRMLRCLHSVGTLKKKCNNWQELMKFGGEARADLLF